MMYDVRWLYSNFEYFRSTYGVTKADHIEFVQLAIAYNIIKEWFNIDTKFVIRKTIKRTDYDSPIAPNDLWLVHAQTGEIPREFLTTNQRAKIRKEVGMRHAALADALGMNVLSETLETYKAYHDIESRHTPEEEMQKALSHQLRIPKEDLPIISIEKPIQ